MDLAEFLGLLVRQRYTGADENDDGGDQQAFGWYHTHSSVLTRSDVITVLNAFTIRRAYSDLVGGLCPEPPFVL
jgi:hypothetical protein